MKCKQFSCGLHSCQSKVWGMVDYLTGKGKEPNMDDPAYAKQSGTQRIPGSCLGSFILCNQRLVMVISYFRQQRRYRMLPLRLYHHSRTWLTGTSLCWFKTLLAIIPSYIIRTSGRLQGLLGRLLISTYFLLNS